MIKSSFTPLVCCSRSSTWYCAINSNRKWIETRRCRWFNKSNGPHASEDVHDTTTPTASPLVDWRLSAKDDRIGILTLQSERTYNALTVEMGHEFSQMVRNIVTKVTTGGLDLRAIVLTGQGTNAFSAGGDLDWLRLLKNNPVQINSDLMLSFYNSFLCIRQVPIPVIAAINGPAIGAGGEWCGHWVLVWEAWTRDVVSPVS